MRIDNDPAWFMLVALLLLIIFGWITDYQIRKRRRGKDERTKGQDEDR